MTRTGTHTVTGTETPGALTEPEPAPIRPPHGPDAARYSGKMTRTPRDHPGRRRGIARHIETVRYPPTGTPGEYAPYQARFLHRPEKVTRSGALPDPGEPNHNEPYRTSRTDAYRRIAAHSRRVIPCHREPVRRVTPKRSMAKHGEPYRNTEPTKSDEAGPQHIATFREPARPEYAPYYPWFLHRPEDMRPTHTAREATRGNNAPDTKPFPVEPGRASRERV